MVRAIDVPLSISQISSAEKIQQIQQQHADMQQRHFQMELKEKDRAAKEKVNSSDETERAIIREKEEQESRQKRESRDRQNTSRSSEASIEGDEEEGGIINITV